MKAVQPNPRIVQLPSVVKVSTEEVLQGYFPEEGHIWIGFKRNWGETRARSYWLENVSKVKNWQFFVPSYIKRHRRRCREAILGKREWIVVEADQWSLEQQYWIHRRLSKYFRLGCLCWSGGKSLHGSYCMKGVSEEQIFKFYRLAVELGVNDCAAYFPEQHVRFPGGWNKKTNRVQSIYVWNI
jgi:hypothetical protein